MKNCNVVLSALNISRQSDFPWSKLRTPHTFLSAVMKNIIALSERHNLERIIICSAWGVAETEREIPRWFSWLVKNSNIGVAYVDHERQEYELRQSQLNWTIVRPTGLTNFRRRKITRESYASVPKPRLTISRNNVAKFMLAAINRDDLIKQSPVISE